MTDFDSLAAKDANRFPFEKPVLALMLSLAWAAAGAQSAPASVSNDSTLAQAAPQVAQQATVPAPSPASTSAPPETQELNTVTVTATRRREPAREVPMQVDTLSTEQLQNEGAKTLSDYLADEPGVDVKTTGGAGTGAINIRGVTTGDQTISTVSTYIDDVSVGSSSAYAAGETTALDMGLLDLNHIELLRGPQGTLYGAGAMGGLLKYVTNVPDTNDFSGQVSVGGTMTKDGADGNTFSTILNIPLSQDVAGLRVSAFSDHFGGYVNAVGPAGGTDINGGQTVGGRVSVLLEPTDRLTIRLTATDQEIRRNSSDYVDYNDTTGQPLEGALTRQLALREPYQVKVGVASSDIEYDFGWARLNSITSYQSTSFLQRQDLTYIYGPAFGLPQVYSDIQADVHKTTQEFRLTSPAGREIEWLAGFYYDNEDGGNKQYDTAVTQGDLLNANLPSTYQEYAAYGDVTWNVTPRFSVTGGLRIARNTQTFTEIGGGELVGPPVNLTDNSSDSSTTYLATAKYALTPTSNVYVRVASGYRPGGPNFLVRDADGNLLAPPTFQPDTLWSYEAGYKADLFDKTLSIQTAIYDIRWKDIQQFTAVNGINVIANGGAAQIDGGELSATYRPTEHLRFVGGIAYNDARLTENAPGLAQDGAPLPNNPKLSANFSGTYSFPLMGRPAYVGFSEQLVGHRNAGFDGSAALPNFKLPGYALTDLQAGVDLGRFQIALFVRNLLNKKAELGAETDLVDAGVGGPAFVNIAQPLTVGTTLTAKF